MTLDEITIQPEEAETVRSIYLQYIAGISFKQFAEQLQAEKVPYDEDKSWNKNMVSRILEDDRYIGKAEFPALITAEQFDAIGNTEYETVRLRRLLTGCKPMTEPDAELLQSAVSKVRVTNKCVTVTLKNGQTIERRDQM